MFAQGKTGCSDRAVVPPAPRPWQRPTHEPCFPGQLSARCLCPTRLHPGRCRRPAGKIHRGRPNRHSRFVQPASGHSLRPAKSAVRYCLSVLSQAARSSRHTRRPHRLWPPTWCRRSPAPHTGRRWKAAPRRGQIATSANVHRWHRAAIHSLRGENRCWLLAEPLPPVPVPSRTAVPAGHEPWASK